MIKGLTRIYRAAATAALTAFVTTGCTWPGAQRVEVQPTVKTPPRNYGTSAQRPAVGETTRGNNSGGSSRSGY